MAAVYSNASSTAVATPRSSPASDLDTLEITKKKAVVDVDADYEEEPILSTPAPPPPESVRANLNFDTWRVDC